MARSGNGRERCRDWSSALLRASRRVSFTCTRSANSHPFGGAVSRYLIVSLSLSLSLLSATPAVADPGQDAMRGATYDTVDAVAVYGNIIVITGVVSGERTSTEIRYPVYNDSESASRCDRLAMLAVAKPGKYQFAMVDVGSWAYACKLIVRSV